MNAETGENSQHTVFWAVFFYRLSHMQRPPVPCQKADTKKNRLCWHAAYLQLSATSRPVCALVMTGNMTLVAHVIINWATF